MTIHVSLHRSNVKRIELLHNGEGESSSNWIDIEFEGGTSVSIHLGNDAEGASRLFSALSDVYKPAPAKLPINDGDDIPF